MVRPVTQNFFVLGLGRWGVLTQPLSAVLRELCEKMMRLLRFAFSREKLRQQPCIELYFATACGAGPAGPSLRAAYQAETSVAVFILASISATSPS